MKKLSTLLGVSLLALSSGLAIAQSTGASPADPNNERNQRMAPGNNEPSDPAADSDPLSRVPTAPVDRRAADREEGGATGLETGSIPDPSFAPPPQQ